MKVRNQVNFGIATKFLGTSLRTGETEICKY
jgi:hypothetical protein